MPSPRLVVGAESDPLARVRELATEQAALRQVAAFSASESSPNQLFAVVADQAARIFGVPLVRLVRYDVDGSAIVGGHGEIGDDPFPIGSRWPLGSPDVIASVRESGRPARVQDDAQMPGRTDGMASHSGMRSAVAGPIVIEGKVWGAIVLASPGGEPLAEDIETRLEDFTELVATAIANAQSRVALRRLADEQAALRRVATLVARGVPPEEIFSAVSGEIAGLFGAEAVIARFEPDGSAMVVVGLTEGIPVVSIGTRWELEDFLASTAVYRTGRPARNDHTGHRGASGQVADSLRKMNFVSTVSAPIMVGGRPWGVMTVSDRRTALPPGTEERVANFTDLVATAIANAESRGELAASEAHAHDLAIEQDALRRVATLVAKAVRPEEVFSAVTQAIEELLDAQLVTICRCEPEGFLIVSSRGITEFAAGSRWPLDVPSLPATIYRAGRPVRIDDFSDAAGLNAAAGEAGISAAVGVPIIVGTRMWGSICAASTGCEPFPGDAEEHLARFTDLVATSVSNAIMRDELAASRARVIAAADEARRRIERDLHDGAQQRLVTLTVALRRAQAKIPSGLDELGADVSRVAEGLTVAAQELRELSRGIHPSILTEGGLSPALKALARRSTVRVSLDVGLERRLRDQVEAAAYYTVSEALTNASKHAAAGHVWVSLGVEADTLHLTIRDDGVGGADAARGSGLTGLRDRVEALGGEIAIQSPRGEGTCIEVEIPLLASINRDPEPSAVSHVPAPASGG